MPFTPFHMAAGFPVAAIHPRAFSVVTFGVAQIVLDIEPLVRMLLGDTVLHGPSHTLLGALLLAPVAVLLGPLLRDVLVRRLNQEVTHYQLRCRPLAASLPRRVHVVSALVGTTTHVALDSLMHVDMQPLWPLSAANPPLLPSAHAWIYPVCAALIVVTGVAWVGRVWRQGRVGMVETSSSG